MLRGLGVPPSILAANSLNSSCDTPRTSPILGAFRLIFPTSQRLCPDFFSLPAPVRYPQRMRIPILLAAFLLVSGCSAADPEQDGGSQPIPPGQSAPVSPAVECLTVSSGAIAGLQWGLDDRNGAGVFTATRASAIKNPSSDLSWFVAGEFSGPGVSNEVGVWTTIYDPTTAPDTVAYSSVDAIAKEFSSYMQPNGYSAALDGVDEVRSCL